MTNDLVGWMFAEMWRYTVLTFRIFAWVFRGIVLIVSIILNRGQRKVQSDQSNLFDQAGTKR